VTQGAEDVTILRQAKDLFPEKNCGWVLVSYHSLLSVLPRTTGGKTRTDGTTTPVRTLVPTRPQLLTTDWCVVIFDEAHRLRGRNSIWTKSAMKLSAKFLWMLTGSPVVNNPGDMWPLLRLCKPKENRSYWAFVKEWCQIEETHWATKVLGIKPELERAFHSLLDTVMLRRTLETVIEEHVREHGVPPVWTQEPVTHIVQIDLTPTLQRAHDVAKKEWFIQHPDLDSQVAISSGAALITKLRQLTSGYVMEEGQVQLITKENPKLVVLGELMSDLETEPLVIFCWYRQTARLLLDMVQKTGRPVWKLTGDETPQEREKNITLWTKEPDGVIIATIESLQEGANLQHSSTVIFMEHGFLPTVVFDQCVGRVRRFGQTKLVNVYHFIARQTVDVHVWQTLLDRQQVVIRALLDDLRE
jgi:SNF2 family DNA or RNA helicase